MSKRARRELGLWISTVAVLVVACCAMSSAPAQTTWYVDDDAPNDPGPGDPGVSDPNENGTPEHPYDAIQEAIDEASAGDTVLVLDGEYTGNGNRDLLILDPNTATAITVRSENGPANCVIDCEGSSNDPHRAFEIEIETGEETRVEGFKIVNGYVPEGNGGAVLISYGGEFRIANCVFEDNYVRGVHPDLGFGGAIYNYRTSGAIVNCEFTGNDAEKGGAVASYRGDVDIVNCSFVGNVATTWAGAVDADSYNDTALTNCRFAGNSAPTGGAASCGHDCNLTFTNCTMHANQATNYGGGVYVHDSDAVLGNCILWGDEVPDPNDDGPEIALEAGSTVSVSYSDVAGGADDVYVGTASELIWGQGNIDADPKFVDPGAGNLRLLGCSPCWDAGNNDALPSDEVDLDGDENTAEPIPIDLDGKRRTMDAEGDQTETVDMGAYERWCFADITDDGVIDLSDLSLLLSNYPTPSGMTYEDGDLDCDGNVDLGDLSAMLGVYRTSCPAP
jgi:hypothetical protein